MACVTPELADAVLDGLQAVNPNVRAMVLSGSYIAKEAERRGIPVIQRGLCRPRLYRGRHIGASYRTRGFHKRLARGIRTGAHDGAKEGKVVTNTGKTIDIAADSVCVHGDNPKAIAFTKYIRKKIVKRLTKAGVVVANFQNR